MTIKYKIDSEGVLVGFVRALPGCVLDHPELYVVEPPPEAPTGKVAVWDGSQWGIEDAKPYVAPEPPSAPAPQRQHKRKLSPPIPLRWINSSTPRRASVSTTIE